MKYMCKKSYTQIKLDVVIFIPFLILYFVYNL